MTTSKKTYTELLEEAVKLVLAQGAIQACPY
jgi:hypothetical protein